MLYLGWGLLREFIQGYGKMNTSAKMPAKPAEQARPDTVVTENPKIPGFGEGRP